jgi:hypothetical protein
VVTPADGRVLGSKMYAACMRWCADHGHEPMTPHAFGLDAPWEKIKKGGNVWYLNWAIAEAYSPSSPGALKMVVRTVELGLACD